MKEINILKQTKIGLSVTDNRMNNFSNRNPLKLKIKNLSKYDMYIDT